MKKIISLIIVIGCVLFIVFSPSYISSGLGKSIYELNEEKKQQRFEGHIKLWHVVSFKTPCSSGYSFITSRMRSLEKTLPYTYIDVTAMTISEADERLKTGEKPDVISYPLGFMKSDGMIELEKKSIVDCFDVGGKFAYPYMADSYVLAVNCDMLLNSGIMPSAGEMMEKDVFLSVIEEFSCPITFSDTYGLDKAGVINDLVFSDASLSTQEKAKIKLKEGAMSLFLEEGCAMIICPYSEYIRVMDSKKAPDFSVQCYDISGETDLIQLVSAFASEDEAKNETMKSVCACFVGATSQKKLANLMMFPVMENRSGDILRINAYNLLK